MVRLSGESQIDDGGFPLATVADPLLGQIPDVDHMLADLVAPAQAKYDQLDAAERELRKKADELRAAKTRLQSVIRAATPKQPAQPSQPKAKKATGTPNVTKLEKVFRYFQEHPDEEIWGSRLQDDLKINPGSAYGALTYLEAHDVIYPTGPGGPTGKRKQYKIFPNATMPSPSRNGTGH